MRNFRSCSLRWAWLVGLASCSLSAAQAAEETKAPQASIYDESADGEKQVSTALVKAKKEHKRVFLQSGADWCVWCHRLHALLQSDPAVQAELQAHYVFVLIDVNKGHNQATNDKYSHPTKHGLPVIVLLDADGRQLTTKNSGELEEGDHHSPTKVTAFLQEWAPKN